MLVQLDFLGIKVLKFDEKTKTVIVKASSINLYKVCYLWSVPGETLQDFEKNDGIKGKTLWVGSNGGFKI